MNKLIVRWTYGKSPDHELSWQALSLLTASIRAAACVWPDAALVVRLGQTTVRMVNDLADALERIPPGNRVRLEDTRIDPRAVNFDHPDKRNAWYAYTPFRTDLDAFELVLDNDVVIWREPEAIRAWRAVGGMLATCDEGYGEERPGDLKIAEPQYGTYTKEVRTRWPTLNLVTGVVGWGPGITDQQFAHRLSMARVRPWHFCSEQGWVAYNWALWPYAKTPLPFSRVPLITRKVPSVPSNALTTLFDGGHWAEHNIGRRHVWERNHVVYVENYIGKLEKQRGLR